MQNCPREEAIVLAQACQDRDVPVESGLPTVGQILLETCSFYPGSDRRHQAQLASIVSGSDGKRPLWWGSGEIRIDANQASQGGGSMKHLVVAPDDGIVARSPARRP